MAWPTHPDGKLDERDETFKYMAGRYPIVETIREMRYSISKMRLNNLPVGTGWKKPHTTRALRNKDRHAMRHQMQSMCSVPRSGFASLSARQKGAY